MPKSFLARVQPTRQRWKMVDWPWPVEGEDKPKLKLRVLSLGDLESAHIATLDHFKKIDKKIPDDDSAFFARERAECILRAYSIDGEDIADSIEELMEQPKEVLSELHVMRTQFQASAAYAPRTPKEMDALVDYLKKNMDVDLLAASPSSLLIELVITLVNRLPASTLANEHG